MQVVDAAGLEAVFDPALDDGGWPGPLGARRAAVGEAWLGPLGLLARLETELGLGARAVSPHERAAALAPHLAGVDGFWSASFTADPLATSARLLADRDQLALWGWRGEGASPRLAALWAATAAAPPGLPDRLQRVLAHLPGRALDVAALTLVDDPAGLAPLWRQVLAALADRGVRIAQAPLVDAPAHGDLAAARRTPFTPAGDGSLVLLRAQGPLAAAEEVAAALAACDALTDTVIVGADAVLDGALARHGLPRVGAGQGAPASAGLVRLVLATAFTPMDPTELHALLCADPGPVPRLVARGLVRSLARFPARRAPDWVKALADGLALVDEERRDDVAGRLATLLDPVVARDQALSLEQLTLRLRTLAAWAHGRAVSEPSLRLTAVHAERVITLARLGAAALDRVTLRRLVDEVGAPELPGAPAEVGLATVGAPGAVLGPARTIVWWGFTRAHAPAPLRLRLAPRERQALLDAGVTPPDPGGLMAGEARRWRRPLQLAQGALVLVCPHTDEGGAPAHPHPLWDELIASVPSAGRTAAAARLEVAHVVLPARARRTTIALRGPLVARAAAQAPGPIELGETASPSSLEQLLACSLAWTLERKGRLYGGLGTAPGPPGPLVYGNIAHHVMAQVFGQPVASPAAAVAHAEQILDEELHAFDEALLLPDFQTQRAELRRGVVESARTVAELLVRTGARVRGLEIEVSGALGPVTVTGRADLLLDAPDLVLDFKWGRGTYVKLLASGTAFQLVAYAALGYAGRTPGVAYLALQRQELLAAADTRLAGATRPGAHTLAEMHAGALARLAQRQGELAAGQLDAPQALVDIKEGTLEAGVMRPVPKCQYCGLGTMCGKRVRA